jgi:hypothetical protein
MFFYAIHPMVFKSPIGKWPLNIDDKHDDSTFFKWRFPVRKALDISIWVANKPQFIDDVFHMFH